MGDDSTTWQLRTGAIALLAFVVVIGSCSKDDQVASTPNTTTTTSSSMSSTTTSPTTTGAPGTTTTTDLSGFDSTAIPVTGDARGIFGGFWSGDWGNLVMQVAADGTVVGAYAHDEGELVGRVDSDGILRGWWCEAPSRKATNDAGTVEFRLVEGSNGAAIDGRWTYGKHVAQGWRDDWNITAKATTAPPAELTARLARVQGECIPPPA